MYSCTAVGPLIARMSEGVMAPSESAPPARTKSFSWTRICFDSGTRYLRSSPLLDVITISLWPLLTLPNVTSPSISDTIAGLDGLRASNSSVTRGRPPVISPTLPTALGILKSIWPTLIWSFSSMFKWAPTGRAYVRTTSPFSSRICAAGTLFLSLDSMITFSLRPVCSSDSVL